MATTTAKKVVNKFTSRLTKVGGYYGELILAVNLKRHQAALETMLAEQFVFNIVVFWEVFLNELLLTYLVASPKRFLSNLKDRMGQSVKERYGGGAAQMLKFNSPRSISLAKAAALADPKDFNLTAESADQLTKRANDLLEAKFAKPFTLDPDDAQFLDYLVCLRNFLAHRSTSSRNKLRIAVSALQNSNNDLNGSISNIGTYLKTTNTSNKTRALIISERMVQIANKLV
ncbi:MAG TPA: hypothetical protein VHC68_01105 [Candidatus Paceibacterota bacterium]|nr:hypothetical protein [Candidatus Paceibacterota bacterium]